MPRAWTKAARPGVFMALGAFVFLLAAMALAYARLGRVEQAEAFLREHYETSGDD